jgi:N-acetylmuramoyl-L-alanine amidase
MSNWISHCTAGTSSIRTLLALLLLLIGAGVARADAAQTFVFAGKTLPVAHVATVGGKLAISVRDPGLAQLLRATGASMTWNPGERYVLFTTAEPQIVSFAVGDARYDVGPRSAQAGFAPYEMSGTVYVPFDELLSALYLAPKRDGDAIVIQPQLAAFDVRGNGSESVLVARAGIPLKPRIVEESASQLVYAFDGVGTTLDRSRAIRAEGIRAITFAQSGTVRAPVTTVTIALAPGTGHGRLETDDRNGFSLAIGGAAASEPVAVATPEPTAAAAATPGPQATPAPASAVATVTGIDAHAGPNGYSVDIAVAGDATYDWHRLRDPDNRFWIDIHGAALSAPIGDVVGSDPVDAVRVRQLDATTVRVALSLAGQKRLDVQPSADGVKVSVYSEDAGDDVARAGTGALGNASAVAVAPTPVPSGDAWKFGARSTYVATNPRLIVIDPGHGGSDPGAGRGGLREADLALDMAKRLRDILVARGWQVVLTRTADVDVYKPNDTARDELQARDDIANNAGARMLVSIHVNSFINAGPRGTTTYYSKPSDVALAQAVQASAAGVLGTKDDGIVKSHLYVTLHATMPAVLVETAFISNPDDLAKLTSPDWRQKLALAIADGVKNYAGAPPAPGQSANQ